MSVSASLLAAPCAGLVGSSAPAAEHSLGSTAVAILSRLRLSAASATASTAIDLREISTHLPSRVAIGEDFDKLNKQLAKAHTIVAKEGVPTFYYKALLMLEDALDKARRTPFDLPAQLADCEHDNRNRV